MTRATAHREELAVLALFGFGLIVIIVLIICGLFGWFESKVTAPLPNWAENVLVAISTAAILKMGDVLAALVTLATGRQVESLGQQLATSTPGKPRITGDAAEAAAEAADEVKDAAADKAGEFQQP